MSAPVIPPSLAAPVRKLYRHALESIFAFASLGELHALMAVCREWNAAVLSMPPIHASVKIRDSPHCRRIVDGRLRRHISALRLAQPQGKHDVYPFDLSDLSPMSTAMPGLHIVRLQLTQRTVEDADLKRKIRALSRFTALRRLEIHADTGLRVTALVLVACNQLIEACGLLPAATMHTLQIELPRFSTDVSFAPLKALTRLRVLDLRWSSAPPTRSLSDDRVAELCALTSIEQMLIPFHELQSDVLPRMCDCPPGSTRSWTRLGFFRATPEVIPCFVSLSSLTSLRATWQAGPDCSSLAQFTQITELSLRAAGHPVDANVLTRALKACTQIESLELALMPLVSRHLEELLPCLPRLHSVTLFNLPQLESLRCFATPALSASLTNLCLWYLTHCPGAEVAHLLGLRSLRGHFVGDLATPIPVNLRDALVGEAQPSRLGWVS